MKVNLVAEHIQQWLSDYLDSTGVGGFIIGISGGIDSAVVSKLCALTGRKTIFLSMPIRQTKSEYSRASKHIDALKSEFDNVTAIEIDLTATFEQFEGQMPFDLTKNHLAMANSRSRLRMMTLYAVGQANNCLVVGTGNKIEDFGIGFFTKYGDGGVDISPIADITKTQVFELARYLNVISDIIEAKPTDGLFEDGRSDEDQIGATYPELEWAMAFQGNEQALSEREAKVLSIYKRLNRINQHKINPIPVCRIPNVLLD
ncbi:MAG: NAD(+) synthase [Crocinitomicaceae bacterium]|nr:NAD(+) synthase [Crocinitomicaceae bacterium]